MMFLLLLLSFSIWSEDGHIAEKAKACTLHMSKIDNNHGPLDAQVRKLPLEQFHNFAHVHLKHRWV